MSEIRDLFSGSLAEPSKKPAKKRFELRGYLPNTRGRLVLQRNFTQHYDDPQDVVRSIWHTELSQKGAHSSGRFRFEVVDLSKKKGKLAPVVSLEELERGMYRPPPDEPLLPPGSRR